MQGVLKIRPLESPSNTAAEMRRIVEMYHDDIGAKKDLPLNEYYELVKALPYKPDPKGLEFVSRPRFTLDKNFPIRDCDDKAVLIGSYLYANGIPFRFEGSSKKNDGTLHHVYVIANMGGKELILDATYPYNQFGKEEKGIVYKTPLTGEIMDSQFATLEGNELGFSFRKIGRRLKKAGKIGAMVATGPVGLSYGLYKNRRALSRLPLSGDGLEFLAGDELGRSLISKIGSRIKKTSKSAGRGIVTAAKKTGTLTKKGAGFIAKNPALKTAIASFVPGGPAALALARGAAGKKETKAPAKDDQPGTAPAIDRKILIGGGFALLAAGSVLYFLSKRK